MFDLDLSVVRAVKQGMGGGGVEEWVVPWCVGSRLPALACLGRG